MLPAAVGARLVDAREQLLPAAGVVPHELVVAASRQRRRAGRAQPPRRLEQQIGSRAERRRAGGSRRPCRGARSTRMRVVLEHDAPPSGNLSRGDATASHRSRDRLEDVPVRGQAAVDGEVDAGDRRSVVGGEERARRRDLVGRDEPAQRDAVEAVDEVLHHSAGHADLGHLGVGEARADAVDADAVRAELERHRPVQTEQARLRRVVARVRAVAARGVDRGDVDDRAAARRHLHAGDALRHQERAAEVRGEDRGPSPRPRSRGTASPPRCPALLTSTSIRPQRSCAAATAASTCGGAR